MIEEITVEPIILLCSFRYALGRRTYITSVVSDCMIENIESLRRWELQITTEIRGAITDDMAGDNCDVESWLKVIEAFETVKEL